VQEKKSEREKVDGKVNGGRADSVSRKKEDAKITTHQGT